MKQFNMFLSVLCLVFIASAFSCPVFSQENDKIKEGLSLYYSRDFTASAEIFKQVLVDDPGNSLAIMYLTDCAKQDKKIGEYLNEYEEKALADPKNPYIKCYLGFFYFCKSLMERDDVFEESINMFQEALKMNSNLALGYNGMGTVYYQKRLMPRARSYFVKAVKLDPNDSMSLERIGDIYLNDDKNFGAAKSYFEEIIALYPSYPDAYFFYGSASQASEDFTVAIESYKKAMERDPLGLTQGYYAPVRIGDIYFNNLKNYSMAIEYYEQALKINPENSYALKMVEKAKNPPKDEENVITETKKEQKDSDNPKIKENIKEKIDLEEK